MIKDKSYSILDLGNYKIRFAVFDKDLNENYSENLHVSYDDNYSNHFLAIEKIIKKAEKKIKSHIENIILITDINNLTTIDISFFKTLDEKGDVNKVYDNLTQELTQLVETNYPKFTIVHLILNNCTIDNVRYIEIPREKKNIKNIKVELKFICFPKTLIDKLKKKFNELNINILNIFCTSYIKSISYLRKLNLNDVSFLEIGWERTSFMNYKNNILKSIFSIPIGSFHITKDISKIFKINFDEAEKIKKSFNQSETEFSYQNNQNNRNISLKEIIDKKISIDLLKKVILYRVQEIIDLIYKKFSHQNLKKERKQSELFLIGQGSILFNNNSFHIDDKFEFNSINFYNENDIDICKSGLIFYLNNHQKPKNSNKKQGLFERFFNFFQK